MHLSCNTKIHFCASALLHFCGNLIYKIIWSNVITNNGFISRVCFFGFMGFLWVQIKMCTHLIPFINHSSTNILSSRRTQYTENQRPTKGLVFTVLKFCWSILVFGRGEVALAGIYRNYWFSIFFHVLQQTDSGGEAKGSRELHEVFKGQL